MLIAQHLEELYGWLVKKKMRVKHFFKIRLKNNMEVIVFVQCKGRRINKEVKGERTRDRQLQPADSNAYRKKWREARRCVGQQGPNRGKQMQQDKLLPMQDTD